MLKPLALLLFYSFMCSCLLGQNSTYEAFRNANPAPSSLGLSIEEKVMLHSNFLDSVNSSGDLTGQLFGNLYMFLDQVRQDDYPASVPYLLAAETIAAASNNRNWVGLANYHRGLLNVTLRNFEAALSDYLSALENCRAAADSLCITTSLEQVSVMYTRNREFETAQRYLDEALPMIKRFGEEDQLGIAYNNYGNLLYFQKKHEEAIFYTKKSIEIHERTGRKISLAKAMHNLANNQKALGNYKEAIAGFEACVAFNRKNNFRNNIIQNYSGLGSSFQRSGNYEQAFSYLKKYINLKDSINGENTEREIAALTAHFKEVQHELVLEKKHAEILTAQASLNRIMVLLGVLLALALLGLVFWSRQKTRHRAEKQESRHQLQVLTRLLAEKNAALVAARESSSRPNPLMVKVVAEPDVEEDVEDMDETHLNLFDHSILTSADWTDFKALFEKSYPGYLSHVRNEFSEVTESEERLFLLIKLKLSSKEISNILGISTTSVKKTRNRLRKKLPLKVEDGLEDFIYNFKSA